MRQYGWFDPPHLPEGFRSFVSSLAPARLEQRGSPRRDQSFHFVARLKNGRDWQALSVHDQAQFPSVRMGPGFAHRQVRVETSGFVIVKPTGNRSGAMNSG